VPWIQIAEELKRPELYSQEVRKGQCEQSFSVAATTGPSKRLRSYSLVIVPARAVRRECVPGSPEELDGQERYLCGSLSVDHSRHARARLPEHFFRSKQHLH